MVRINSPAYPRTRCIIMHIRAKRMATGASSGMSFASNDPNFRSRVHERS